MNHAHTPVTQITMFMVSRGIIFRSSIVFFFFFFCFFLILAKKKKGVILWKMKLDVVSVPSICYTVCLQYAQQTPALQASTVLSDNELPNKRKTPRPCQAGKQIR